MSSQIVSSPTEQEIQVMITLLEQLRTCNYVTVSTLVFILYDIMINLEKEIPLVWHYRRNDDTDGSRRAKKSRDLLRLLFILSRYYGLVFLTITFAVNNITGLSIAVSNTFEGVHQSHHLQIEHSCRGYFYYLILAGTVLYVTVVNVILAMRISALYEGHLRHGLFLGSLVVGEFMVEFSICVLVAVHSTAEIVSSPPWIRFPGCILSSRATPAFTLASWLTALIVSTVFCAMTLKGIFFRKREESLTTDDVSTSHSRIKVLQRDCVVFYFLTFAIVLVATVVLAVVQNELSALPVPLLVGIYSYCASRLVLNIRVVDAELRQVDMPDDPDSLPSTPCLTIPEPDEQPTASSSSV